ncbi:unnamed protein product, partial [Ixodes persulcatus]
SGSSADRDSAGAAGLGADGGCSAVSMATGSAGVVVSATLPQGGTHVSKLAALKFAKLSKDAQPAPSASGAAVAAVALSQGLVVSMATVS